MWKIYLILALWSQSSNAQQGIYRSTSRVNELNGSRKNTLQSTDFYLENDYVTHFANERNNTVLDSTPVFNHTYNANANDRVNNIANNSLYQRKETSLNSNTQQLKNNNDFSTQSIIYNGNSTSSNPSLICKIPMEKSFNAKLFEIMSSKNQHGNLVYSPISLQTLLAFIFTMSVDKLHDELAQLLVIPNDNSFVAKTFENVLQKASLNKPPTTLIMANKLYYDYRFGPIDHSVHNLAKNSFASDLEQIDFLSPNKAANTINSWVSDRTRNLIRNIVTPLSIAGDSSALLVNAIYFKSEWLTKFATYDTEPQDFFVTKQKQVRVDMMYNEDVFRYGDFADDLQASVVELPYKTSNLSMLLFLPKDIEGLVNLERKLQHYDLETISSKLKRETVIVKLPKFKIEFETDMIPTLQELGLNALFNNGSSINLFKNQQKPLTIDQFKHKSFINVNEAGTEAAATTVAKYIPLSIPINIKYFTANHPFVFVIRDFNTTYFIGHVVQF